MGAVSDWDPGSLSPTKRQIIVLLGLRPRTVSDLARALGIQKSAVHKHLQRMVVDGAIERRPSSRWVYYRVRDATASPQAGASEG